MRIGAGADRTGCTQTVVLAVSALAHTAEAMALNDALVSFTLRCADDVHEVGEAFAPKWRRDGRWK